MAGGRFLITIMLAKTLGVSEFGNFAFYQWLVDMVFVILAFGLPGSASRFFAEFRTQSAKLLSFERWFVPRSLAIVGMVAVTSPMAALMFSREGGMEVALLQAGWSASAAVWALLMARAQGLQKFQRVAISNSVYVLVALAGCAILPAEGGSVSHAMLLVMIATAAAAVTTWLPLPRSNNEPAIVEQDVNRQTLRLFGINVWISSLVSALVWSRGEIVLVRTELGVTDVAIYSSALSLAGIATQGVMLLTGAVGQHLTQLWGEARHEEAIILCRRFTDMLTFIAGMLATFLVAFSPELVLHTFGPAYAQAGLLLAILGLGAIGFTSAAANQLLLIQTNGAFGRNANIVAALSLFIVAFPLIGFAGVEGAAVSRALVQIGVGSVTLYFAHRLVSTKTVNWVNQAKVSLILMVFAAVTFLDQQPLYLRFLEFSLSNLILMCWLRDDRGHLLFSSLLGRIHIAIK